MNLLRVGCCISWLCIVAFTFVAASVCRWPQREVAEMADDAAIASNALRQVRRIIAFACFNHSRRGLPAAAQLLCAIG
jgi:hypothetical protein